MTHIGLKVALATVLIAGFQTPAHAGGAGPMASPDDPYALKTMITGSMLPQDVMRSPVPFDRRYEQLTAEQKAVIFRDYEALPAGDEPPFPAYGLGHMLAKVRQFAAAFNLSGKVIAKVDVDADGNAVAATVYRSPNSDLSKLLGSEMALEKFKPGLCHGQPCAMSYVLRLDMMAHTKDPVWDSTDQHGIPNGGDQQM